MCDWIAPAARDPLDGRALAACSESRRRADDGATFFLCALHGAAKSRVWLHEARMRAAYPEAYRRAVFGHYDARWRGVKPRLPAVGEEEYHLMQRASPKIAPAASRPASRPAWPASAPAFSAPAPEAPDPLDEVRAMLDGVAVWDAPPPDPLEEVRAMLDDIAGVEGLELLDWASIVAADAAADASARPPRPIGPVRRTRSALR